MFASDMTTHHAHICVYFLSLRVWRATISQPSLPQVMANLMISTSQAHPPHSGICLHQGAVALGGEGSGGGITKSQRKTARELGRDERSCSARFSAFSGAAAGRTKSNKGGSEAAPQSQPYLPGWLELGPDAPRRDPPPAPTAQMTGRLKAAQLCFSRGVTWCEAPALKGR